MEGQALKVPLPHKDSDISNAKSLAMEKENRAENLSAAAASASAPVPEVLGDSAIDAVASATGCVEEATQKKPRKKRPQQLIKVSNTKNPFIFYLNLAKRHIKQYNSVELSALGMAIPTVVTIAQTLKRTGLAVEKSIKISSVESRETETGRLVQKAKIEILLEKAEKSDENSTISEAASLLGVLTI